MAEASEQPVPGALDVKEVVCRFDQDWHAGRTPRIQDYLGSSAGQPPDMTHRKLLELLVQVGEQLGRRFRTDNHGRVAVEGHYRRRQTLLGC